MRKQFLLIGIAALLAPRTFAENVEKKSDPVLARVEQMLQPVFNKLDPVPHVEYSRHSESITVKYRTRRFMIYSGSKIGKWSEEAHEATGPDYGGFMLKVFVQNAGTVNQAVTPQTIKQPYWKTDLDVTLVTGTSKQIYWGLSYGSRPDEDILSQIRKTLRELEGAVGVGLSTHREAEKTLSTREGNELTGVLKKNTKALSPYMLQIDGGGPMYLRGDVLKTIPDGTRIWITGRIRSTFYDNSSDPTPAMTSQWHIFMNVDTYKVISKPYERPKRNQQRAEAIIQE